MAWRLSLIFSFVFVVLGILVIQIDWKSAIVYGIVVVIASCLLLYMAKTKNARPVYWVYAIAASLMTQFTLNFILNTAHYTDFLWILSTIIFAFTTLGKNAGRGILLFHCLGIAYYVTYGFNEHYQLVEYHNFEQRIVLYVEILLGLFTISYLLNQYVSFNNYTKNQLKILNQNLEDQNEAVLSKNRENITLVKEVHHRVKNNLQIIISLLRMQRSEIESEEAQKQFNVAINRILTMSMIHQKLYQEKEPSKINIRDYLEDLTAELVSLSEERVSVRVNLEADEEYADLKMIVPLGLLINELVANSMKHAFKGASEGTINIQLKSESNKGCIHVNYWDSGEWLEPTKESGFGLELIEILTEQMEGKCTREGSRYSFEIPLEQ
ncbi:MAG: hypothetical protein DCO96_10715 [Fluviicola sp. XM-24bin1]|nr:MAG: hypothetical protein DCO96_10715 [Fluviicola sp. XM-24bin1]